MKPAAPCIEKTARYVDCGNGTVTDTVTGLIWIKTADCVVATNWAEANRAAAGLQAGNCNLTDGSAPGDWRLPTRAEWEATRARAVALGCTGDKAPALTNDAGDGCLSVGPSAFTGVAAGLYWSSSSVGANANPTRAWFANLIHGFVGFNLLPNTFRVWPVRGGRR